MKLLHHESYQDIADVRGESESWCKSSVKLKGSHIYAQYYKLCNQETGNRITISLRLAWATHQNL